MRLRQFLLSSLILPILMMVPISTAAAREPATPEQRIERLERQVRQVQRQVFPKGQPADTAGFVDTPAATQEAVTTLSTRLDAIERQMADLVRTSEENGHRLAVMEADLARLRADNDSRFKAIEAGPAGAASEPGVSDSPVAAPPAAVDAAPPPVRRPRAEATPTHSPIPVVRPTSGPVDAAAAGEAAYTAGFDLWSKKKYDAAITQLRAMVAAYPGHRRVSWANNLIGRALLDEGQPRAAANELLANYRGNPKGERAPDSLFYLGQSLVKLNQLGQACKAYEELTNVYGESVRPALKAMIGPARAQAQCK